jgi:hypothetical protein
MMTGSSIIDLKAKNEKPSMEIAITGAGNVGTALGNAWIKRGHEIAFGVREGHALI